MRYVLDRNSHRRHLLGSGESDTEDTRRVLREWVKALMEAEVEQECREKRS